MQRTATVALDQEFQVGGEIVKTWEDEHGRFIRGAASGIEEDRDGERMSKACIDSMVKQINKGQVTLNGLHQDDWLAEMGTVVKASRDSETDQLVIDTKLPGEGEDPIADKAWNRMVKEGKPLGFSVGGKLRKAFFEQNDLGKRRKVLDDITLKHVMLTAKPAYQHSFAEAVAKTWEGEPPPDEEWFEEDGQEELFKAAPYAGGDSDSQSGQDSKTGDRFAGRKKKKRPPLQTEPIHDDSQDDDDEDDESDDVAQTKEEDEKQRRLACPNCGHEFAAPLPSDQDVGDEDQSDEQDRENDDKKRASKSRQEMPMPASLAEALDVIKSQFAEPVEEPEDATPAPEEAEVSKTAQRVDELEGQLADAFETIAKTQQALAESLENVNKRFDDLPLGRRSVARILPPIGDDAVEKTTEDQIAEAPDAFTALKALNAARGIE